MSQLDLFGGGETDEVESASDSPLSSAEVASQINRWPGLYLGTSSWSFPGWRDLVYKSDYTAKQLADTGLRAYSGIPLFRTVSLDRTYYKSMSYDQFSKLSQQVPPEFRFIVKAPRDLLHPTERPLRTANLVVPTCTLPMLGGGWRGDHDPLCKCNCKEEKN